METPIPFLYVLPVLLLAAAWLTHLTRHSARALDEPDWMQNQRKKGRKAKRKARLARQQPTLPDDGRVAMTTQEQKSYQTLQCNE